jgi:hypothetical protein
MSRQFRTTAGAYLVEPHPAIFGPYRPPSLALAILKAISLVVLLVGIGVMLGWRC